MVEPAQLEKAVKIAKELISAEREKKTVTKRIKEYKDTLLDELENLSLTSLDVPDYGYKIEVGEKKTINIKAE